MIACGRKNVSLISVFGAVTVLGLSVYPFALVHANSPVPVSSPPSESKKVSNQRGAFPHGHVIEAPAKAEEVQASSGPVMVIRFNQENVYFRNPLRSMVFEVAKTKPNAKYEIQSLVPSGKINRPSNVRKYADNVQNVINVFGRYGVSPSRISVKSENSDSIDNQEIRIFVK
ncbi:MAG: hypothetical protein ABL857_04900 [Rickettsiales bacterium]